MKNLILIAGLTAANLQGCGSAYHRVGSRPDFSNQRTLKELQTQVRQTCNIESEIEYEISNSSHTPESRILENRYNPRSRQLDNATISIPVQEINSCVRNIIRGAEISSVSLNQNKLDFKLGENSDLNSDLVSIYAKTERADLSEKINCVTADFSGYFVKGLACYHNNLNPLEKSEIIQIFRSLGYNSNFSENQIFSIKK